MAAALGRLLLLTTSSNLLRPHLFLSLSRFSVPLRRNATAPIRALSSTPPPPPRARSEPFPSEASVDLEPYLSCSMPGRRLKVAVLLSGGVDSSVALRLLHAAGHTCTAFYLKIWFQASGSLQVTSSGMKQVCLFGTTKGFFEC